jgi:hypothetical protein
VHEQIEFWRKRKFLVAELYVLALSFLDDSTSINWLDNSINVILQVLNQDWVTLFDSKLNGFDHLWICQSCNLKSLWIPGLSQPSNTLKLWINNKTISLRVVKNATIFNRYPVWRKCILEPSCACGIISQYSDWIGIWTHWDIVLAKEWGEFCVHNLISKALVEWSNV